jgi:hypothetical protein
MASDAWKQFKPRRNGLILDPSLMLGPVLGCETWSLTSREEHRLGVLENRVLRRVFGPKGDEVTGEWRKFYN